MPYTQVKHFVYLTSLDQKLLRLINMRVGQYTLHVYATHANADGSSYCTCYYLQSDT